MKLTSDVVAVVTGGASGLGEATAIRLASYGVRIAIFDRDAVRGEQLAKRLDGVFCVADVTSEEQVDAAFSRARARLGQERILVNCAGTGNAIRTVGRDRDSARPRHFPLAAFDVVIQVNLIGTFRCIAKSAAGMLDLSLDANGERGVIINTASIAAEDGQVGQAAYAASKAGVVGMTLPVARDLAGEAIRVNTILPGVFNTPLMCSAPPAVLETLTASIPFPARLGRPEEFALLVESMICNPYLNAAVVRLDGAARMPAR
jgi:NAD(P)-dependent dehydrogenase (short-subunit alcohol dehydrogenase family)